MANMIKTTDYSKNQKQILIGQDSYYIALPVLVSGTANATLHAGQPVAGDITARDTAFTVPSAESDGKYKANGIILHDVVLDADGVLAACVDLIKLETAVQTFISKSTGLDRIIFVKGSAY